MIKDFINKQGDYIVRFTEIYGSGWSNDLENIINNNINPSELTKQDIISSWSYSEREYRVRKEEIDFLLHLDDDGPCYFKLLSEKNEKNKQKLRNWANIVAIEAEKLKKS